MMCHRIGRSPISTMGLGLEAVSSDSRVPRPPARMTTFTTRPLLLMRCLGPWRQCICGGGLSRMVCRDKRLEVLRHEQEQHAHDEGLPQPYVREPEAVDGQQQEQPHRRPIAALEEHPPTAGRLEECVESDSQGEKDDKPDSGEEHTAPTSLAHFLLHPNKETQTSHEDNH